MSKIHLVIPDSHAMEGVSNERAGWVAELIKDLRPDVVIHLGDSADLASLSSYDKGKRSFVGRTYRADINAHLDFQRRLWDPIRATKKRLPRSIHLIGNHEQRIDRALDLSPELQGTISYADLELERDYDTVVYYDGGTPGVIEVDGIHYAHYVVSGNMGRALSSERMGSALLAKRFGSTTVGHSHLLDYALRTTGSGERIHGLSAGCFIHGAPDWAGHIADNWWSGVVIKRNVENGNYNPQFVSIQELYKEYGGH